MIRINPQVHPVEQIYQSLLHGPIVSNLQLNHEDLQILLPCTVLNIIQA